MRQLIVGIGDCKLSTDPESNLVTYGLGSCIGITLYDPLTRVGGMLHYMLPDSSIMAHDVGLNPTRAAVLDVFAEWGSPASIGNLRSEAGETG